MDRIEKLLTENNGLLTEIRDQLKRFNDRAETQMQIQSASPLAGKADELVQLATNFLKEQSHEQ